MSDRLSIFLREQSANQEEIAGERDWFERTLHLRRYRDLKDNKMKTT